MNDGAQRFARIATIKVRNILSVRDVLEDLGCAPAEVLTSAALPPDLFSDPERTILYSSLGKLASKCVQATGRDDFGFRVGMRQGVTALGLAGLVTLNCATVREALRTVVEAAKTSDTGGVVSLDARDGTAFFGFGVVVPGVECADQIADGAIAILVNIMRQLCGHTWSPDRVTLTRPPPREGSWFSRFFGAPIEYCAPGACIAFDAAILDRAVAGHDRHYWEILRPLLDRALAEARDDFVSTVKAIAGSQIAAGGLSRTSVCRALGLSAYALSARLKGAGVTFEDLADEMKYELAQGLLARGRTIRDAGSALGFSDTSAFTRAFRRWTGETPARWRAARSERGE